MADIDRTSITGTIPQVINQDEMGMAASVTLRHVMNYIGKIEAALEQRENRSPAKQAMISHSLFLNIIYYNVRIKKLTTREEEQQGYDFKKIMATWKRQPFHIFEFVVNQNFDKNFDNNYIMDWNRFFRFCNRIDLNGVSYEDPYTRMRIREANRAYPKQRHDLDLKILMDSVLGKGELKQEIVLVMLELGLLKFSQIKAFNFATRIKLDSKNSESYLKTLIHLIALTNDEAFLSEQSAKYYFEEDTIMVMLRNVFEKLNELMNDQKDSMVPKYVNMILISIFNPPYDFYSQSIRSLEQNISCLPSGMLKPLNSKKQSWAIPQIEVIEDIMLQILQKYYSVCLTEISPDLCKKIRTVFASIRKADEDSLESAAFRMDFAVSGGCYSLLSLLHILTPSADLKGDESATDIIGEGLDLLGKLCDKSGVIGSQIFKERCFNILRRLAWFNLKEVAFLLLDACRTAPWLIENSAVNIERLHSVFFSSFQDFILPTYGDPPSVQKCRAHRAVAVLCYAVRQIIRNINDLHVKQTMQLRFQEAIAAQANIAINFILDNQDKLASSVKGDILIGTEWINFEPKAKGTKISSLIEFSAEKEGQNVLGKIQNNRGLFQKLIEHPNDKDANLLSQLKMKASEIDNSAQNSISNEQFDVIFKKVHSFTENIAIYPDGLPLIIDKIGREKQEKDIMYQVELHYFVLGLFNECVIGIEAPGVKNMLKNVVKEKANDVSLDKLKNIAKMDSDMRIFFFSQLVNIYCNCILLETDVQVQSNKSEVFQPPRRDSLRNPLPIKPILTSAAKNQPQERKVASEVLMFQKGREDISHLLTMLSIVQLKDETPENRLANRDLMYRSVLRFMSKFFKGMIYEKEKVQQQADMDQEKLLSLFIMKRELVLDMCDVDRKHELWEDATLFMNVNDDSKKMEYDNDEELKALAKECESITDSESKNNFRIILKFIQIINKLYDVHKEYKQEIQAFEREGPKALQDGYSNRFNEISTLGAISMDKFIQSMRENDLTSSIKLDLFSQRIGTLISKSTRKTRNQSDSHTDMIKDNINQYRKTKSQSLQRKADVDDQGQNLLLKTLGEGTDNSKDMFYKNILIWLMRIFSEQLKQFDKDKKKLNQAGKAKAAKDVRDYKEKRNILIKNSKEENLRGFGQTFISEPLVPQLVTVIGNLLNSDMRPRDVFLETFFTKEKSDVDHSNTAADIAQRKQLKDDKRGLIVLLIEAALSMQTKIKRRLFTGNIKTICEHYFLACLTIKDLVKGNMIPIKKFIGKDCFNTDQSSKSSTQRNIVQELFQGLVYDKNLMNVNNTQVINSDRVDLAYYNIITLTTLTELVSGPCKENQDSIGDSFVNVFVLLEKTNMNYENQLYKVQEAMVLFLVGLLEESNLKNCKRLSSEISPTNIYKIICKHISQLCTSSQLPGNDSLVGRAIRKIMVSNQTKKTEALTGILREYYRTNTHFSNHPSITIAVRLYFLMREIISGNFSKRYERFLKEREQSLEMQEFNMDKLIEYYPELKASEVPSERGHKHTHNLIAKTSLVSKANQIYPGGVNSAQKNLKMATTDQHYMLTSQSSSVFEFVKGITASVEILHQTGESSTNLQIYFPRLPSTFNFSEEQKYEFLQTSSINDSNSKVLDLMNFVAEFQIEMNRSQKQWAPWLKVAMQDAAIKWYMLLLCFLGAFINLMYFVDYNLRGLAEFKTPILNQVAYIVRLVILSISGLTFLVWMLVKFPEKLEKQEDRITPEINLDKKNTSFQFVRRFYKIYIKSVIHEALPLTSLVHISACVLSMYVSIIFISLHLYTLMAFSRTTRYVIKSMTEHIDQLMMTFLLAIICIYFYSIIVADFFGNNLIDSNTPDDLERCQTLGSCFFYSTVQGLTNGDGVGIMIGQVPQGSPLFIPRLLVNLSFFILLNLAASNIIFGIILDTFAELRDSQQARGNSGINL